MMRKSPLLLGAWVSLACFACGSVAGPSEPSTSSPSSASGGAAGGADTAAGGAAGGANGATGQPGTTQTPGATTIGSFGGSYSVPTTPDLAAAATFDMPELNWTVTNNVATLAYNLPRALVGKALRVTFTGPFDPATGTATLTGPPGTSQCTATATAVSCSETMQGIMPVNPDLAVVAKLASSYPGPSADRTTIAQQFSGDPIGIANVDLTRPGVPEPAVVEDPGGGHKGPGK